MPDPFDFGLWRPGGQAPGELGMSATPNLLFVERTTGEMRKSVYDHELVRTAGGRRIAARRCRFIVRDGLSEQPDP